MIDEPASFEAPMGPVCPWCSAPLVAADVEHCPSCGAAMTADQEPVIPGVTTIEPEVLARQARTTAKPRRQGLMSLFVGREDEPPNIQQPTEAELPALARPTLEVRREMLRIELEAAGVLPAEDAAAPGEDAATPEEEAETPERDRRSAPSPPPTDDHPGQ